jgi:hypothetical protein
MVALFFVSSVVIEHGRAQKPSATFLGDNVAWEKSTSS